MAALTPVESVEALLSAIDKSTLLSADALAKARETAAALSDPKAVARVLIKDGTLTRWQADQLLHGYHRLVIGKYKLLDQLETSPTGRVYLAEHVQMGRRHALKVLAKRLASNPDAVARFLKGAQNACGLDHKNISHVYDVSQDRLGHFVVMEYVEGQSLEQLVEKSGPLKLAQALDYASQVADGLAYAHSHGVVHGDLKPANLVRDNTGVIKILEIGQDGAGARPETDDADEDVETASLAAVIFQAPEMRGDGEAADIACDIYSLGSVLTFLLTGKAAKNAATAASNLEAAKNIPPELINFCRELMADAPAERPRSMESVLGSIHTIAQQLADSSKPAAPDEKSPEKSSQKRDNKKASEAAEAVSAIVGAARPKTSDEVPVIVVNGHVPPVLPPPADFSIQTRGRIGKNSVPADAKSASLVRPWSLAALTKRFSLLVVAGAIGGTAVFALGIGAIVVLLVVSNRTQPIVKTNPVKAQLAQQAETENAASQPEANPVAADANPNVAIAASPAPAETNPVVAPPPADANPPAPAPTSTSPPSVASTASANAPPPTPATSPAELKPAEPKPASAEAPAAVVVAAPPKPPPPPAAAPAKKSTADPFKSLPKAVSLPPLPEPDSPVAAALAPVSLGPCDVDADTPVTINLLGGDTAIRATRQKFELQARAGSTREWDVQLTGTAEPALVATFSIKDGALLFQWTEEAAKQSLTVRHLMNCALAFGKAKQTLGLRTALKGQPLVIDIEKPSAAVKWAVPSLPQAKQVFVEVTRTDGFSKLRQDPKGPTNIGDTVMISTGPAEKSLPLLFKLTTASGAASIDVRAQPSIKVEGWTDPRPYRRKDLIAMQGQQQQDLGKLRNELRKAKDARPRTDAEKDARDATITRLANDETAVNTLLNQLRFVLDFANTTEGAAKVHFRAYCLAGDAKIDLLKTDEEDAK